MQADREDAGGSQRGQSKYEFLRWVQQIPFVSLLMSPYQTVSLYKKALNGCADGIS